MELEHSFSIPVTVEKAWPILLDIEQIAPCMPGASIDSVDGDDFTGSVKVKLGPINLTYKGQAKFVEKNEQTNTAVIDARGRDSRGNGTASAKITAGLVADGESTTVKVVTDLNITGKPAQFGRGVMVDVGNKLIGQFADCLAGKLSEDNSADTSTAADGTAASTAGGVAAAGSTASGSSATDDDAGKHALRDAGAAAAGAGATAAGSAAKPVSSPRPVQSTEPEPIDLLELAGGTVAKRAIPVVGALLALIGIILLIKKRGK
ncbi:carbon monoxide dehydrogenase subunit G [Antricoccus suffuscus]|uniref:Carbon monoxide dehydrogenase subunit G n=1 Tax=Antricoccus suffuscus TaxID=1629062 RepID=A0A2T0ZZ87_9ACTN|nr:SRPBCC family protein [Antricoccus suffuscus]PRZ41663.1 carbon monoxide dehydrogenase subunit G [Antricoccus suffuscus]